MERIRFGVLYGFRNPASSPWSFPELYARTLDQIELVDELGYDHVWITEHHFVEDGYMPSPLVVSGAIAARTRRVMIGQDVLLLPFAHPVRLAEDLAVLDNLSDGRAMLGAGMGYVPSEFAAMGVARRERRARMDETLEILRLAFSEDSFDFSGEHFSLVGVRVRPRPVQPGGPLLWVAAMSEAGARRAARCGAHLLPQGDRAAVVDPYFDALDRAGVDRSTRRVGVCRPFVVDDDPAAAAATSHGAATADLARGAAAASEAQEVYATWFAEVPAGDRMMTQLVEGAEAGRLVPQDTFYGTAVACIAEIERMRAEFGVTDVIVAGLGGNQTDQSSDDNLTRLAREVIPHFGSGRRPAPVSRPPVGRGAG